MCVQYVYIHAGFVFVVLSCLCKPFCWTPWKALHSKVCTLDYTLINTKFFVLLGMIVVPYNSEAINHFCWSLDVLCMLLGFQTLGLVLSDLVIYVKKKVGWLDEEYAFLERQLALSGRGWSSAMKQVNMLWEQMSHPFEIILK